MRTSISKIASGYGSPYDARLSYRPVPGVRKSGIPAEVLQPAPTMTTTLRHSSEAMMEATRSRSSGAAAADPPACGLRGLRRAAPLRGWGPGPAAGRAPASPRRQGVCPVRALGKMWRVF